MPQFGKIGPQKYSGSSFKQGGSGQSFNAHFMVDKINKKQRTNLEKNVEQIILDRDPVEKPKITAITLIKKKRFTDHLFEPKMTAAIANRKIAKENRKFTSTPVVRPWHENQTLKLENLPPVKSVAPRLYRSTSHGKLKDLAKVLKRRKNKLTLNQFESKLFDLNNKLPEI